VPLRMGGPIERIEVAPPLAEGLEMDGTGKVTGVPKVGRVAPSRRMREQSARGAAP
jgi:hypothetical protein